MKIIEVLEILQIKKQRGWKSSKLGYEHIEKEKKLTRWLLLTMVLVISIFVAHFLASAFGTSYFGLEQNHGGTDQMWPTDKQTIAGQFGYFHWIVSNFLNVTNITKSDFRYCSGVGKTC